MDNIFDKSLLGLNIKHLRKNHKLTQAQLCDILGVKPTTLSNWEVGISSPDMDILAHMSIYFGISVDKLAFIESSKWGDAKPGSGALDGLKDSVCEQCELRNKIISQQDKTILLLEEKIEALQANKEDTKYGNNDIRQTG
jgi:transcriptional regulator with XRE-family HTH domain